MNKLANLLATVLLFFPAVAMSNGPAVNAYVVATGTYGNGAVYVFFDRPISTCGSSNRIDLAAGAAAKNVLAIGMLAYSTGKAVRVRPGTCSGATPIFGSDNQSYFYLINDLPAAL